MSINYYHSAINHNDIVIKNIQNIIKNITKNNMPILIKYSNHTELVIASKALCAINPKTIYREWSKETMFNYVGIEDDILKRFGGDISKYKVYDFAQLSLALLEMQNEAKKRVTINIPNTSYALSINEGKVTCGCQTFELRALIEIIKAVNQARKLNMPHAIDVKQVSIKVETPEQKEAACKLLSKLSGKEIAQIHTAGSAKFQLLGYNYCCLCGNEVSASMNTRNYNYYLYQDIPKLLLDLLAVPFVVTINSGYRANISNQVDIIGGDGFTLNFAAIALIEKALIDAEYMKLDDVKA